MGLKNILIGVKYEFSEWLHDTYTVKSIVLVTLDNES